MTRVLSLLLGALFCAAITFPSYGTEIRVPKGLPAICKKLNIDPEGSDPITRVGLPPVGTCKPILKNGLPLPDPKCSPGAFNPTLTLAVLKTKGFTTKCVRDLATTPTEKQMTYKWYKIAKPAHNTGQSQVCELDHIISLELGGADTLDNLVGSPGTELEFAL